MFPEQEPLKELPKEDVITYLHCRKSKFNALSFFRITALFLLAVIFFVSYLAFHINVMQQANDLHELEKDLKQIRRENERLQIELAKYTSMEHIDAAAVYKVKMCRPAQIHYVQIKKGQL